MASRSNTRTAGPTLMLGLSAMSLFCTTALLVLSRHLSKVWSLFRPIMLGGSVVLLLGLFGLFLALRGITKQSWLLTLSRIACDLLYPVSLAVGRAFGLSVDVVRRSYISTRNLITNIRPIKAKSHEVLVLLPHCLQWSACAVRITTHVSNCRRCGRCVIGDIVKLSEGIGFHLYVASGGTSARRVVKEMQPKAVVGIACERDLVRGMQDVKGIPVIGMVNTRPHGPCLNTQVDLEELREVLASLMA